MTIDRETVIKLAREAGIPFNKYGLLGCERCDIDIDENLERFAALVLEHKRKPLTVKYGCYCDLDPGMEPDGCVIDQGVPGDCVYARKLLREGKTRDACEYWKPIQLHGITNKESSDAE